jgi:hypothetical protein
MKEIIVQAFQYSELDDDAKHNVKCWLDENPLDYENEDGELIIKYFIHMDKKDIIEHCNANDYLFSIWGEPIHHLEKKEVVI